MLTCGLWRFSFISSTSVRVSMTVRVSFRVSVTLIIRFRFNVSIRVWVNSSIVISGKLMVKFL